MGNRHGCQGLGADSGGRAMRRIVVTAIALVLAAAAGASAHDTKVFRDLLIVDADGKKVGSIADGLKDSLQPILALAETRDKRPFLLQMYKYRFTCDDGVS